jgi:hypothetical protein
LQTRYRYLRVVPACSISVQHQRAVPSCSTSVKYRVSKCAHCMVLAVLYPY